MFGKHGLGAMGEFVRERFRDRCPKIIARFVKDAPGQIQRTITCLLLELADFSIQPLAFSLRNGPFKFRHRRVNVSLHAFTFLGVILRRSFSLLEQWLPHGHSPKFYE